MKITVVSDLHLEFGDLVFDNKQGADVLVLSGDIVLGYILNSSEASPYFPKAQYMKAFVQRCVDNFPHVIAVAGNHEFYHGRYDSALLAVKEMYEKRGVHFLERSTVVIDGVKFFGGTLWTDFNSGDPLTMYHVSSMMNDFRIIKWIEGSASYDKIYRRFKPDDAFEIFRQTKQYFERVLENTKEGEKVVIVTHHAPTSMSTHPRYRYDHLMNGVYRSDLSNLILRFPQIKLWTHGHTHDSFDYMVGSTRVVCNPRGYAHYDEHYGFDPHKVVEI